MSKLLLLLGSIQAVHNKSFCLRLHFVMLYWSHKNDKETWTNTVYAGAHCTCGLVDICVVFDVLPFHIDTIDAIGRVTVCTTVRKECCKYSQSRVSAYTTSWCEVEATARPALCGLVYLITCYQLLLQQLLFVLSSVVSFHGSSLPTGTRASAKLFYETLICISWWLLVL